MSWTRLPALAESEAGYQSGCLTCGPTPVECPLDAKLAVGFGICSVTRDGEAVYGERMGESWERAPRLRKV